MHRRGADLIGSDLKRAADCRRDVESHINLQNLVLTNDEAQTFAAGNTPSPLPSPLPPTARPYVRGIFFLRV